jgi:TonB family protein
VGLVLFLALLATALVILWPKGDDKTAMATPTPAPTPSVAIGTPTPPVGVKSGVVRVESMPAGAAVFLDGRSVGQTPMDIHDVAVAAPHEVKVELEGYATVTESVMLTAESPRTVVTKTLTRTAPATGTVDVTSTPAGATVKIDGTSVGITPLRGHKINVGTHRVEVSAEGYEPAAERIKVTEGARATVNPWLKAAVKPVPTTTRPPVAPSAAPTADPTIYDENDARITTKPVKTIGKSAEYPKDAVQLKRGQRASVTVSLVVLESGDVTDVQIVESAGATVDEAVIAAYRSWKFTPGMKQGAKVKVRVQRRQTFLGG